MKLACGIIVVLAAPALGTEMQPLMQPRMQLTRSLPSPASLPVLARLRGGAVEKAALDPGMLSKIVTQVANEFATCGTTPAKATGFAGACCNWFLGLSALYDAVSKGPELIALPMTFAMLLYSSLFGRWAGWDVSPRNFILAGSHMFNIVMQCNQLRRALLYKLATEAVRITTLTLALARTLALALDFLYKLATEAVRITTLTPAIALALALTLALALLYTLATEAVRITT